MDMSDWVELYWGTPDGSQCIAQATLYPKMSYIDDIAIRKEFQGRGLSSQILDVVIKQYKCNELLTFEDGKVAQKAYEQYGFKKVSAPADAFEGCIPYRYGAEQPNGFIARTLKSYKGKGAVQESDLTSATEGYAKWQLEAKSKYLNKMHPKDDAALTKAIKTIQKDFHDELDHDREIEPDQYKLTLGNVSSIVKDIQKREDTMLLKVEPTKALFDDFAERRQYIALRLIGKWLENHVKELSMAYEDFLKGIIANKSFTTWSTHPNGTGIWITFPENSD